MPRSINAQLAVDLYNDLRGRYGWTSESAWQGIARLLLTCEIFRTQWEPFQNVVVYVDSNRFKPGKSRAPSATLRRAEHLSLYLARELGIERIALCENIGLYYQQPTIRPLQPHNPVGHAFRSLVLTALELFGDPGVTYEGLHENGTLEHLRSLAWLISETFNWR